MIVETYVSPGLSSTKLISRGGKRKSNNSTSDIDVAVTRIGETDIYTFVITDIEGLWITQDVNGIGNTINFADGTASEIRIGAEYTIGAGNVIVTINPPGYDNYSLNSPTALTSKEEIVRTFSLEGVLNHTEDWDSSDDSVINEIIYRSSEEALQFLRGQFDIEDIKRSYWVRMKVTYIACYYLSKRQGNASLYGDEFNRAMLDLTDARDGLLDTGMPTRIRAIVQTPMMDSRMLNPGRINPALSSQVFTHTRFPYSVGGFR